MSQVQTVPERRGGRLRRLPQALVVAVLLVLGWAGLNAAVAPKVTNAPASEVLAAALAGALFAAILWWERHPVRRRSASRPGRVATRAVLAAAVVLLVVAQWFVAHAMWTPTSGWDSEIMTQAVIAGGAGPLPSEMTVYYELYPTNTSLTGLLALLLRAAHQLGFDDDVQTLLAVNCVLLTLTVVVTTALARRLWGIRAAVTTAALVTVLVGLSAWSATVYTDTFGVLLPVATLYCWVRVTGSRRWWAAVAWAVVGGVSLALGMAIKPTIAVVAAATALVLVGLLWTPGSSARRRWRPGLALAAVAVVAGIGTTLGVRAASEHVVPVQNADRAAPLEYWVLLGLSYTPPPGVDEDNQLDSGVALWGTWNGADEELVLTQPTTDRMREVAREAVADRLERMGPSGYLRFLADKISFTFVDGTFGLFQEGRGKHVEYPETSPADAPLRDFYRGEDVTVTQATIAQAFWLLLLALAARQLWTRWRPDLTPWYLLLAVSIGGVIAYTALFETRSRYLFVFVPLFALLASASIRGEGASSTAATENSGRSWVSR